MKPDRKKQLPTELQKCTFEGAAGGPDEPVWAIEVPEDAGVQISMQARCRNGIPRRVDWGGGNQPGRWELRRVSDDGEQTTTSELDDKVAELDEITLSDWEYRLNLNISILADPDTPPEQFAEDIEMYVKDMFSELPAVVESQISEYDSVDTGDEICPECAGTVSTTTGIGGTNWRCEDCGWTASARPSRIGNDSSKTGDHDE